MQYLSPNSDSKTQSLRAAHGTVELFKVTGPRHDCSRAFFILKAKHKSNFK